MGKNSMNFISKMILGMSVISQALMAAEDGKITSTEMLAIFTSALQGMGMAGVDLKGITFVMNEDGSISVNIPEKLVSKLNITVS